MKRPTRPERDEAALEVDVSPAQRLEFRRVEDEHGRLVEEVAPARPRAKRKRRRRVKVNE